MLDAPCGAVHSSWMKDLIGEIETIVASGTKLDIAYYINEVIDEEG